MAARGSAGLAWETPVRQSRGAMNTPLRQILDAAIKMGGPDLKRSKP
jgi:hypothetical protein